MPTSPGERERILLANPELWAMDLTHRTWGWKNMQPWQRQVLTSQSRRLILKCSRQSGKSSILSVKSLHRALTTEKALILIIAEQRQSNEDIIKCKNLLSDYQRAIRERYGGELTIGVNADNKTSLEFSNGARIISLPATEKVRGFSAPDIVWIDEAAFLKDEVFVGLEPMLEAGRGQLILSSTPNGNNGFFYTEWGNDAYERFDVPWTKVPHFSKESIQRKILLYGEPFVRQEYGCEFLDDVASLFPMTELEASKDSQEDVLASEMARMNDLFAARVELI
jgi:hypothetical protein